MKQLVSPFILFALLIFVFFSCGENDDEIRGPEIVVISRCDSIVPPLGGELEVVFQSTSTWHVEFWGSSTSYWLSVDKKSGNPGTHTIKVTVANNEHYMDEEFSIAILGDNDIVSIPCKLLAKESLFIYPKDCLISSDYSKINIEIRSNFNYKIDINVPWIKQRSINGSSSDTISFDIDKNIENTDRQGTVEIYGYCEKSLINIKQYRSSVKDYLGHGYVDLGLNSGLLWATLNVGADKPEEYGPLYAWGEIEPRTWFRLENYKFYSPGSNWNESGSFLQIGENICGTEYDVARSKWGGEWRMPTNQEFQELLDNCTFEPVSVNDIVGHKVIGPNGNYIFISSTAEPYSNDPFFYYWSGTGNTNNTAYFLNIYKAFSFKVSIFEAYRGCCIRPVFSPNK